MSSSATDHYQSFLDKTTTLLMRGDHGAISNMFTFPNRMETLDGMMVFNTPEDMISATQEFLAYIRRMRASDFFRICREAAFMDGSETRVKGQHESYMLQGGTYAVAPYTNEMILELQDGQWLSSFFRSFTDNASVPILSPKQLRERALAKEQETKGKP